MTSKVVSLDTARKLAAAGWDTKTRDYWYCQVGGIVVDTDVRGQWELRENANLNIGFGEYVAAPDVSDLLEALPDDLRLWKGANDSWLAYIVNVKKGLPAEKSPAEALAALWLALHAINALQQDKKS